MSVNSITNNNLYATAESEKKRTTMNQMDFIQLFVVQLASQNPLEPMSDKDLSAQLAQLSQVEGISSMTSSMNRMQAASLIGKTIVGTDIKGSAVEGKVSSYFMNGNSLYLTVGSTTVELSAVNTVKESS